jgi:ribonucleoside-diphosphate reductase alpha chain
MTMPLPASALKRASSSSTILPSFSLQIWEEKYRFRRQDGSVESSVEETWERIASACAKAEPTEDLRKRWECHFYEAVSGFKFIPGGRIVAGAGTSRDVTLFNCFVMGEIEDDMGSIFANHREAALTMQQGGGVGIDFSPIRPKGSPVRGVGADASGPVSFMEVWDAMCKTIMSAGSRRGAMMGTLRCDHPDIEAFIEAKADRTRLRNFNVSVLVTDAFMEAVRCGKDWPLVFDGKVYRTLDARSLWQKITRSAYDYAEPGVIFIDRVNALNNLSYCETIPATNPCGEVPLPPYGACLLGSLNLAALVEEPFTDAAQVPDRVIDELVPVAVWLLDNVIEISKYPLSAQEREAKAKRRLGLGVTGLGDALIMCGKHYGSSEGRALAERWMSAIAGAAYLASAELAAEKGAFPLFETEAYLQRPFVTSLRPKVAGAIKAKGMRNGLLMAIAPTGTISLLAGNVSGGIEPVFEFEYQPHVLNPGGSKRTEVVQDFAYRIWREQHGDAPLSPAFVSAHQLSLQQRVLMQAALQRKVEASISKTVNCPPDMPFEEFESLYLDAYRSGLKGCAAYRPNAVTGEVLSKIETPALEQVPTVSKVQTPPQVTTSLPNREAVLSGFTYKIKWPASEHAIYVTINDVISDGPRLPYEIFINSKNLEHYAWTVALTRMISAIFRRGGDIAFVIDELKAVFDPRGGAWVGGSYVPSLLAFIGLTIEEHFQAIGKLAPKEAKAQKRVA